MVFNWFDGGESTEWGMAYYRNGIYLDWKRDSPKDYPKIHPAQKPVSVLKVLIETFTDEGDVVVDPCCGSGTTLRAAVERNRSAYGFETDRTFYRRTKEEMLKFEKDGQMSIFDYQENFIMENQKKQEAGKTDEKEHAKRIPV